MSEQPRPAGTEWWCTVCQELVVAVLVQKDTDMLLIDEAYCPDPLSKHAEVTTLIGRVATERLDRKELAASVTIEIHASIREEDPEGRMVFRLPPLPLPPGAVPPS